MMLFSIVWMIFLSAFQVCAIEISMAMYDLCETGEAITSLNGSIYTTLGEDCSRIILAPEGYRIELNVTKNTRIVEQDDMFIFDGATKYHNGERARISRHRPLQDHLASSSSNAVLIQIKRIVSKLTNVEIKYKMFKQPSKRCLCLPVTHGDTVCTFVSQFYRDDTLYKRCAVSCGQQRFIPNRFSTYDFQMQCFMGNPEHDIYGKGKWNVIGQHEQLLDDKLITCARIFPTTRLKLGYKFSYSNVSCADINQTMFKDKILKYISSIGSVSSTGECFKSSDMHRNLNCTVESVNFTCTDTGGLSKLVLTVRDNIINSTNETVVYKRYLALHAKYYVDIFSKKALVTFIYKNLTVNNSKAAGVAYVYQKTPLEDCPSNAGFKIDYLNGKYGCLNCPPHFYNNDLRISSCEECQNGTRRNNDEARCVRGPRSYPPPSQEYCKNTCNLGKFYNANSSFCEWCPYGTYQNSTTLFNPVCTPCPDGLTTGFVGARNISECIELCPAGLYLKYTQCVECDVGYFMSNSSNRLQKCYQCATGFTTLGIGTIDGCVQKCSVGEYFNMTTRDCLLCPNNTYQDETNATNTRSCKECPLNTTTATTGSTMVSNCLGPCGTRQYIDKGLKKCSPCPQNTYQDEGRHVSFGCKSCGQHKITLNTGSMNVSECIYTCSKGEYFNLTSKSCEKCHPPNMFQDEIGKDTCKFCPGKTFTLKAGSEKCISPCQFGEFLNKSAEKCKKCSQGFYQNISDYVFEVCNPCPIDFYNDKTGEENCTRCPDGTITFHTGAITIAECIETCQPGFYLNKTTRSCKKCSKGFYQDQNGYRYESCTKCPSANLTTLVTGASSAEHCVGYCASSPCLNGGKCTNIDNDFNCSCSMRLRGKQCETFLDENVSDKMYVAIRLTGLTWNVNLKNTTSTEFKDLAARIERSIREEFENDTTFRTVKVIGLREGSVISDVELNYVASVNNFATPLDTLTSVIADGSLGGLSVDASSVTVLNYTCSQPLGMENGRIPDSAITSGSTHFYHPPKNARLNNPGPGWAPVILSGNVYLQVDFLEEVKLTAIATRGSSYHDGSWLQTFYFETSSDGKEWSYYVGNSNLHHIFIANDDVNTTVYNTLPYPITTRYVRMFEYHFKVWISYRVEFYGCPIPKSVPLPTDAPLPTREPVTTRKPSGYSTRDVTYDDDDDGDNVGLIVGVVFGVLALLIIIALVVVWWMKRNKNSHSFGSSVNAMQLKETH